MALRLLHTADWHLGHALHGIERTYEHEKLVAWLLDAVERESVDAVLVAGDVFDAANPPTEAQALWYRFLVEAWRRVPHLQVVVIGGNHDSAARLDATDPFLDAMQRLHVIGGVPRRAGGHDLDRLVVPLRDRSGAVRAWLAAVPFLRASETGAGTEDAVAEGTRRFYRSVLDLARARREPDHALVAMGHLYLTGAQVSELSERRLVVGNQSAVSHDVFPDDVAYAALGHLHLAQPVGGRENVRYSGSLLPLSLKERDYEHEVVVVDLDGPRVSEVRPLRLPRFVEILRVPEEREAATAEDVLAVLRSLPERGPGPDAARPLLEVSVLVERPEPALRQLVEDALSGKDARLARLGVTTKGTNHALGDVELKPLAELQPEHVFLRKWEKDFGGAPETDVLAAFHELLDQVNQERR
ncbi:MAG TPA: exonuclease subunit SbcD [Anaeromyxobacteraceae bacterium]|nr:exonuclease subunit SbcD [Anaeromyxobacteraceae bacterium]